MARTELRLLSPDPLLLATRALQLLKSKTWGCSRTFFLSQPRSDPPANPDSSVFQWHPESNQPLQRCHPGPEASRPCLHDGDNLLMVPCLRPCPLCLLLTRKPCWGVGGFRGPRAHPFPEDPGVEPGNDDLRTMFPFSSGPRPLGCACRQHPTDGRQKGLEPSERASWRRWGLCQGRRWTVRHDHGDRDAQRAGEGGRELRGRFRGQGHAWDSLEPLGPASMTLHQTCFTAAPRTPAPPVSRNPSPPCLPLGQGARRRGPQPGSISITWERVRNAASAAPPSPTESETLGHGPAKDVATPSGGCSHRWGLGPPPSLAGVWAGSGDPEPIPFQGTQDPASCPGKSSERMTAGAAWAGGPGSPSGRSSEPAVTSGFPRLP